MKCGTNAMSGWVKFPVESTEWKNSREGGMIVKLVVIGTDKSAFDECCGVCVTDVLYEVLAGDDKRPKPEFPPPDGSTRDFEQALRADREWEEYHYPNLNQFDGVTTETYMSRDYLAAIVLGSTGWAGANENGDYWYCTFGDLTADGQALYRQVQALYPDCTLHLLTFLDT